jgi:tetratricopeptide (TPR) repeat protein
MKYAVVIFCSLILIAGCGSTGGGKKEYDVSQKLLVAGNYQEAIAYLESALAKEPDNKEYKSALADAKSRAFRISMNQVKKLLAQQEPGIQVLEQAESLLKKVANYPQGQQELQQQASIVSAAKEALIEKVRKVYAQALVSVDAKDWIKANFDLTKVQNLYPNFERTAPLLNKIKVEGVRDYLTQSKGQFDDFDFNNATITARKALALDPSNRMATSFLKKIASSNSPAFFTELALKASSKKDWAQVVFACKKVLAMQRNNSQCTSLYKEAEAKQISTEISEGNSLLRNGYVLKAIGRMQNTKELLAGRANPDLQTFRDNIEAFLDAQADQFIENGRYGLAWYLYELIREVNPTSADLFQKSKTVEDTIIQRVKKSIAVFDFKSPSYNQDAGVLIANNLIANLFNSASQDVNILERENLKSILEEMKLGQIGVVSENTAKEMGRIYGIDVAIMGSVLIFKVDESSSASSETVRYKVGEEIGDNIEYLNWKVMNPSPSKSELANAPAPKIMTPTYIEREYDVKFAKKVGFIQISFRIVDVTTGQNTRVETIERKKIIEDRSNEGVKDAGVEFDPLEIMTDTELLQLMTKEVVEELSLKVLQPLRNQERVYFDRGEELLLRRQENLNAVEEFVNAIFDEKVKSIVNSPVAKQSELHLKRIVDSHRFTIN